MSIVLPGVRQALDPGWTRNRLWRSAKSVPSLDLNFASSKSLVDSTSGKSLITFTRASTGTYVGSDGLVKTATTNEARFDHNPTTGESLGLLVEEARTNLLLQSEDFSNAYWTKTDCTITANESIAPDGTLTADLWSNTGTPGTVNSSNITKDGAVRTYTASLWVKGTLSPFTVALDDGTNTNRGRVQYNLNTNAVIAAFNDGTFTNTSGTLTRFLNGWVRVTVTTTTGTGTTIRLRPFFSGSSSTLRVWGAQVEEGAFLTSYIPTTTATATRAADVASITGSAFTSFYNQTEGTLYLDNNQASITGTLRMVSANDNTSSNRINLTRSSSSGGNINFVVTNAGTNQVAGVILGSSLAVGTSNKVAAGYKAADFGGSVNGLTPVTQSTGTVPSSLTQLTIANGDVLGTTPVNSTTKRLCYWNTRLPNTVLQAITQP